MVFYKYQGRLNLLHYLLFFSINEIDAYACRSSGNFFVGDRNINTG